MAALSARTRRPDLLVRVALAAAALTVAIPAPASAGHLRVVDMCTGVDHFPSPPPRDRNGMRIQAPSVVNVGLTIDGAPRGSIATVRMQGAGNTWTQRGDVNGRGQTFIPFGIFSYDRYEWTLTQVRTPDGTQESPAAAGSINVDDREPPCDRTTIASVEPPVPEPVETTSPTPTPSQTTSSTPTPSETPAVTDRTTEGGSVPWWAFIPGGFILAALGGLLLSKNPCPERWSAWKDAESDCERARAAAERARAKADAAREAEQRAADERRRAFNEFHEFRRANPMAFDDGDGGSWVEDSATGERITSRDLELGRQAAQETWDEYQESGGGAEAAEQAMDEWSEQGTSEGRDELRDADEAARQKAKDLEQKLEEARQKEKQAEEALKEAEAEADAAQRAADEACAKARAAADAWAECVNEKLTPPPPAAGGGSDGGDGEAEDEPGGESPGGGPGSSEEDDDGGHEREDEGHSCCPNGIWVGYGWSVGGILVVGRETTGMTFFCVQNPDHYVTVSASVWRVGAGLGGEGGGAVAVIWGADHPFQVAEKFKGMMTGIDGDLSVGPMSAGRAIKMLGRGVKLRKLLKILKRLGKSKVDPRRLDPRDLDNIKDLIKGIPGGAATGAGRSIGGQVLPPSGPALPDGVVIPIGGGLQAGVWLKFWADMIVTEYDCCSCTQDGVLPR